MFSLDGSSVVIEGDQPSRSNYLQVADRATRSNLYYLSALHILNVSLALSSEDEITHQHFSASFLLFTIDDWLYPSTKESFSMNLNRFHQLTVLSTGRLGSLIVAALLWIL